MDVAACGAAGGDVVKQWTVKGYCKRTGQKITITVWAATSRHARTVAYDRLTYPRVIGRVW